MTIESDDRMKIAQRRRWRVHFTLIVMFPVSIFLVALRSGIGLHELVGLAFAGLVVVHLIQRRNRIRGLAVQLTSPANWGRRGGRLAWSDLALTFIFVNLIVSGVADYFYGQPGIFITVGLPKPMRWHAASAIALLVYLVVHVIRRFRRLRHSRVN